MKKIFFVLFYILLSTKNLFSFENTKLELEIYKNLRCLVCQGQSIADSNSDFAQTLKSVVKDKINEGKSKDQIYDFLTSKYGEWIIKKKTSNFFIFIVLKLSM